ncbi:hypothetical protein BGX38DRAFT_1138658 [Terfezia claveryi]|nr:hypothetical protein BGX38DRAFT_1138658 [Terfezia claveryi]
MNRRFVILLITAFLICFSTVSAFNVVGEIVDFVLEKRQENNDTATRSTTATSPPVTTPTTTSIIVTTSDEITTTEPQTPSTTTIPTSPSTTETPTTTETTATESTTQQPGTTTRITTRITTKTREVATVTLTISGTRSMSTIYTSEIQTTVETSTGLSQSPKDSGNNGSGGISISTRNTIIGVVVGVGGAVIIGALLIVGFRLRRKKSGTGFDDDIRGSPSSTNPMRQQDAFKATLDQYHKPPGTVNPSANF